MDEVPASRSPALATTLGRYFHTLRHLRPQQVLARLRLALPQPVLEPLPPPGRRAPARPPVGGRRREESMLGPNDFVLLNERSQVRSAADWNDESRSKLWLYNLHYFDDLNATGADERRRWHADHVDRWVADNPPTQGVGWEPYPISLRSVNWIMWDLRTGGLSSAAAESLAAQLRWLRKRLEYHLMGSHLLANAKALVFGGLYFEGHEAREWFGTGMRILGRELEEQILPDGGHFELSPMYHLIVLEDVLDTINILTAYGREVPRSWLHKVRKQLAWAQVMQHPDGHIPFFNDAALGVAGSHSELLAYACRLEPLVAGGEAPLAQHPSARSSVSLPASGYTRLAARDAVLFFDAAAVGPDYLPGHAHADTLSVELSLFGHRLLVNSGTSTYGDGPQRQRQRGTRSHNTLVIDGEDSSEMWAGFRVARRARVSGYAFEAENGLAHASHDGYRCLPGRPSHERTVRAVDGLVEVRDVVKRLSGNGREARVELVWHFHPDVEVREVEHVHGSAPAEPSEGSATTEPASGSSWALRVPVADGFRQAILSVTAAAAPGRSARLDAALEPSTWHPEFGKAVPNQRLVVRSRLAHTLELTTRIRW